MQRLDRLRRQIADVILFPCEGRVQTVSPSQVGALGPELRIGDFCEIVDKLTGACKAIGEVAALDGGAVRIVPFDSTSAINVNDIVRRIKGHGALAAGDGFSGRAVDALGRVIDGGASIEPTAFQARGVGVLDRVSPENCLATGIRAIDGFLTIGRGQRVGIFAASGVGKSRLVDQIIRQAHCDRIVVCLVGERGREVEALWRASRGNRKLTIVAATSDEPAPLRARAVEFALNLSEYWRDAGEDVLLVVDSITRLAMALREIGLMAGEPPTVRAYTPNVVRELPRIVERCGAVRNSGSITALFTVLSETDDVDDPIVEVMKSLLDGHVVLSRELAQAGQFPAIDIGMSISRLFTELVDKDHAAAARVLRALMARYEESHLMIESGMYKAGSNAGLDRAIALRERIKPFLSQELEESTDFARVRTAMMELARGAE